MRAEGRSRWPVIRLIGLMVVALTIVAAPSRAQQQPISSARGHAQIIAQGVAGLPVAESAWRVVYHTIEPDQPAELPVDLQFMLVDQGTVLVEEAVDRRLLSLGEATYVSAASPARATALDDRPAGYYALDLVAPEAVNDTGSDGGVAIFAGAPFASPPGARDLKLIRDVLAPAETAVIAPADATIPMLILATLGTITVETAADTPVELRVGQAATFTGEVTIRGEGLAPASFAAAVIGRAVDDVVAATPAASPAVATAGTISVRLHACPIGMRPSESNTSFCPLDFDAVDLTLVEALPDGGERDLGEPAAAELDLQWSNLAPGDYILRATGFGSGFDRFVVAGLAGADGDAAQGYPAGPDGGYVVPVTASGATVQLDVFALSVDGLQPGTPVVQTTAVAVRQEADGTVGVRMFACPTVGLVSFDPAACTVAVAPFDVSLTGAGTLVPLTLADAAADAAGYQIWDGLTAGDYVLQVPLMPAGTVAYFVNESAEVSLLLDSTGYLVSLAERAPPIMIDVYAVGPEPVVPTPIPTAIPTVVATSTEPASAAPVSIDNDGDGLTDEAEATIHGTDPTIWDMDGDGMSDGEEIQTGTDPFTANLQSAALDGDGDGLPDADEARIGTDPFVADTDGDGVIDGDETAIGTDPFDPGSFPPSP